MHEHSCVKRYCASRPLAAISHGLPRPSDISPKSAACFPSIGQIGSNLLHSQTPYLRPSHSPTKPLVHDRAATDSDLPAHPSQPDSREGSSVDICTRSPPMHHLQAPRPITACRRPPCRCQGKIGGRHGSDGTTSASVLLGIYQGCSRWPPAASPFPNPFPPDVPVGIAPSLGTWVTGGSRMGRALVSRLGNGA